MHFGFKDFTKPFKIEDILEIFHRFGVSKNSYLHLFFVNFYRRLTMFVGETSYFLKASAASADDECAEYAVCMKVIKV